MVSSQTIKLSDYWIDRCVERSREMVGGFNDGLYEASRSVSMLGIENNLEAQADAKMAEVAFCLQAGIDPETHVRWKHGPDGDYDVRYAGIRIDVKQTGPTGHHLIWPIKKNMLFEKKQFDALVLVRAKRPYFKAWKWMSKSEFGTKKITAPPPSYLLPGTWHVRADQCHEIETL